ncbi:hypothetical protein [Bacillus pumilus]|uniref:hypothetical protein n=1 Tax=Bacillus pumilus TaxID=1408 RepID=UPI0007EEDF4C|nr:hypothetical protein [Bacillus pumilus]MBU8576035.1 hypothetical protein [Bacillus pumilus]OBS84112.1 hypothetical protein BAY68_13410 [Bacillus pumilus]UDF15763.1 hypothetical protein LG951_14990 [Bacillus pumilus]
MFFEKAVIQPFSDHTGDQVRLSKVNGSILMDNNGNPHFYFPNQEAFEKFKKLKADAIRRKVGVIA